jgi:hypothetical protein
MYTTHVHFLKNFFLRVDNARVTCRKIRHLTFVIWEQGILNPLHFKAGIKILIQGRECWCCRRADRWTAHSNVTQPSNYSSLLWNVLDFIEIFRINFAVYLIFYSHINYILMCRGTCTLNCCNPMLGDITGPPCPWGI